MENLIKLFEHIPKYWGSESIIINDKEMNKCFKLMIIMPGKMGSLHYHKVKAESFKVLRGVLYVDRQIRAGKPDFNLRRQYRITSINVKIKPNIAHKFYTVNEPCLILEESTFHDDDDTYREEASRDMTEEEIERLREG